MSCGIGKFDMCVREGDTFLPLNIQIFVSDSEGNFAETPNDLTGFNFLMEVRKGSEIVEEYNLTEGIEISGDSFQLEQIAIVDTPAGEYSYAIKMIEPDGVITTILEGKYSVQRKIVKNPNDA